MFTRHAQNQFASTLLVSWRAPTIVNDYVSLSTSIHNVHFFFFAFTDWDRRLFRLSRERGQRNTGSTCTRFNE
jgi:hypothetical protein